MKSESYDCPLGNEEGCTTKPLSGRIRDFPEVGLKKCLECGITTHDQDLRSNVDYSNGSMHEWKFMGDKELDVPAEDTERRLNAIINLSKTHEIKSILDFGSGRGQMLRALSGNFNVFGLEPEKIARLESRALGFSVYSDFSDVKSDGINFQAVVMFHVIEHLYNPRKNLEEIYTALPAGGILVIETPNADDALLKLYENLNFANFTYWSHHPVLYTHYALAEIVGLAGFEVIENIGVQRYSIDNHVHWLAKNAPGGHEILKNSFSNITKESYNQDLIKLKQNDTLWLIAQKA
jgi:SAM-dependent methyltransferase